MDSFEPYTAARRNRAISRRSDMKCLFIGTVLAMGLFSGAALADAVLDRDSDTDFSRCADTKKGNWINSYQRKHCAPLGDNSRNNSFVRDFSEPVEPPTHQCDPKDWGGYGGGSETGSETGSKSSRRSK